MKLINLIFCITFCSLNLFAQTKTDLDALKVAGLVLKDKRQVYLLPAISSSEIDEVRKQLAPPMFARKITNGETGQIVSDTIYISKSERRSVDSQLTVMGSFRWTSVGKNKLGFSNFNLAAEDDPKNFKSDFNYIVYTVFRPIFIRNQTVCFFYYQMSCGSLCGQAQLIILITRNDKWERWWTVYDATS